MAKKARGKRNSASHEHWKEEPEPHDYPAASNYLSLILDETTTASAVEALKGAAIVRRMARDLLRASRLELLPEKDPRIAGDLAKVRRGERLSPVLLVRGALARGLPLVIADGYHRICASYHIDADAEIPCRLAELRSD